MKSEVDSKRLVSSTDCSDIDTIIGGGKQAAEGLQIYPRTKSNFKVQ